MNSRTFLIFVALVTGVFSLAPLPRSTSAQRVLEARPATSEFLAGPRAAGFGERLVPLVPIDPAMFNPRYRISASDVRAYCMNAAAGPLRDVVKRNAERELRNGLTFGRVSADDITQQVMLKIWENCQLLSGKTDSEMGGYVQRILQNQITDEARLELRQKRVISAHTTVDAPPALAVEDTRQNPAVRVETRDTLAALVAKLTPAERTVLEGLVMNMDLDAIAESMNIQPGTVRDHRTSIRRKYQSLLLNNSAAK
ncbi:RNA polymerase sigma factor [Bradyrhizobium neotropicale]|uniref:HTH luxR-type domain-containing protein n=1 Tax=Bradyrhizobium neotropicale TaxID=1497615 RepID=A0A176ZC14_9BRAD|nr:sigma-70 family RNA polymerase sigma factor [Bradyrhizobium neotropicale]OAF17937.1 hypothetical protein AXW67_05280 [Bradyrhizobium neotropicale]